MASEKTSNTIRVTLHENTNVSTIYDKRQMDSWDRITVPVDIDLPLGTIFLVDHQECFLAESSKPERFNGKITLKKNTLLLAKNKSLDQIQMSDYLTQDTVVYIDWGARISIPKGTLIFMNGVIQTLQKDLIATI